MQISGLNRTSFSGYLIAMVEDKKHPRICDKKVSINTDNILKITKSFDESHILLNDGAEHTILHPLGKGEEKYQNLLNAYTAACQNPFINIQV